eukprot:CAMPEP_0169407812 /NCGR_PEP_ID=MMETSP1017-20121227/58320_1 /TAXON_ID=342587 /ORGANISM="Karlodinium micrum, Strain CCMP2283" /LENGTH=129 /DNA_ID=CAMNT_0009514781 /DNA_START=104 /DNA_END=490 /DNA_ORIENTATION=-
MALRFCTSAERPAESSKNASATSVLLNAASSGMLMHGQTMRNAGEDCNGKLDDQSPQQECCLPGKKGLLISDHNCDNCWCGEADVVYWKVKETMPPAAGKQCFFSLAEGPEVPQPVRLGTDASRLRDLA